MTISPARVSKYCYSSHLASLSRSYGHRAIARLSDVSKAGGGITLAVGRGARGCPATRVFSVPCIESPAANHSTNP